VAQKGWSVALYASFFTAYAATRFLFSIFGGLWVDRFTAKTIFRFYLIPIGLGLLSFALVNGITGALIFLILSGCTTGMSGTVKSAALAEVYGVEKLGTIRSVFTMFMVISTALGPLVVGVLMDAGFSFPQILVGLFIFLAMVLLNSQRIRHIALH
jgi:MFS family permease